MLVFLLSLANAAEIQVIADAPVAVEVDGRSLASRPGERGATAANLAGGAHRVEVFGGDRLLASATVDAGVNEQVRLELRRGQLAELGRGPLPGTSAPCATPAPAAGSIQITGIDPTNVAVWVDGKPLAFAGGSFLAKNVSAGAHDVRVARGAATLYSGEMKVYPDLVRRCVPTGGALDCVHVESVSPVAPPPPPAPPPPAGPVAVSDKDFAGILAAVKAQSFASDQLGVLRTAARDRWFTVAQLGAVLDVFSFSSDKIEAAKLLVPRVVDPANAYTLDAHLTFSSDKEAIRALFGG